MHDAKNRELHVGDVVLVPCVVKELTAGEDYCNVQLVTVLGRRPDGQRELIYAINTGVTLRNQPGDDNSEVVTVYPNRVVNKVLTDTVNVSDTGV